MDINGYQSLENFEWISMEINGYQWVDSMYKDVQGTIHTNP